MLVSNMRGHLPRWTGCDVSPGGRPLIEDCAHTMGEPGTGGRAARSGWPALQTQTYKHSTRAKAGCSSPRARILSPAPRSCRAPTCSMPATAPDPGPRRLVERQARHAEPSGADGQSARRDPPSAIARIDERSSAGTHDTVPWRTSTPAAPRSACPRPPEGFVGCSIQFRCRASRRRGAKVRRPTPPSRRRDQVVRCRRTSGSPHPFESWRYVSPGAARTDRILSGLFDMRLPLTFASRIARKSAAHRRTRAAGVGWPAER